MKKWWLLPIAGVLLLANAHKNMQEKQPDHSTRKDPEENGKEHGNSISRENHPSS